MKKYIYYLIFIALFLSALFIGIFIATRQSTPPPTAPQTHLPQKGPSFPSINNGVVPAITSTGMSFENQNNQAGSLPVYEVETIPNIDKARQIASFFSFTGTPKTVHLSKGNYTIWTKGQSSLTANGFPPIIGYTSGKPTPSTPSAALPEPVLSSVIKYVSDLKLLPVDIPLPQPVVTYYQSFGTNMRQSSQSSATHLSLTYQLRLEGLPLYDGFPENPTFTFTFDVHGELLSFGVRDYSSLRKTDKTTPIISVKEAYSRINTEGAVVAAYNSEIIDDLFSSNYSIKSVSIENAKLAYYYDQKTGSISPIYSFAGSASDTTSGKLLDITIFVSALPR